MDTKYIREFCALAETENFSEAADKLYISQSTLSRHIRTFEAELGVELFARNGKIVTINDNGKRFLPYAKRILEVQEECQEKFLEELRKLNDNLTIGLFSLDMHNQFANQAFEFKESHPDHNITFVEATSDTLRDHINEGVCDIAIVLSDNKLDKNFESCMVYTDILSVILPAEHMLAGKQSITFDKLRKEKFLIEKGESAEFALCLLAARDAGFEPEISHPNLSTRSIIRYVERGHGITVKPKLFSVGRNKKMSVVDLEPPYKIYINIIHRKDTSLSKLGKDFIRFLQKSNLQDDTSKAT